MKRIVVIIVAVTAICVTLVHVRRQEARVRHEIHLNLTRQTSLRRELWNQRVLVARLLAPSEVRKRTVEMALGLIDEDQGRGRLVEARPRDTSVDRSERGAIR